MFAGRTSHFVDFVVLLLSYYQTSYWMGKEFMGKQQTLRQASTYVQSCQCYHVHDMSHVMRKPVLAISEQQRRRSACASAQSDQRLCCSLPRQYNICTCYSRNFKTLVSSAEQAGLSLNLSQTPMTGFLVTWLI